MKKIEITQHSKYTCSFCGRDSVKRTAVGIWKCKGCKKVVAGGAWQLGYVDYIIFMLDTNISRTTAAAVVRSSIRRLREMTEL